jgi:uncharacterized membrane protein YdjX (TVP38/TMEM64 family)
MRQGNMKEWAEYLKSFGWIAVVIGVLSVALQAMFPVFPYLIIAGANVLVFGLTYGFLINWGGALIGATLSFFVARKLGQRWVQKKWKDQKQVHWFNQQIKHRGFLVIMLARMVPIIPPSLINVLGGISKIKFPTYFFATLIGKLPAVWIGSVISYDLFHFGENKGRLAIFIGIAILLGIVGYVLRNKLVGEKA